MAEEAQGIQAVGDEELRSVRGGTFWSRLKSAAKWVKKHVVIGLNKIGIKGTF